ncbi:MAG: hypothetical protein CMB80_03250 [Flammeovirgaceae bacterium]|nr:hypothetical protein [Flammeovirgaceae bacterium]
MADMDYYPAMDQSSALDEVADVAQRIPQVRAWLDRSKRARERQADRWRKNENLYYGRHWASPAKGQEHQSRLTFNFPLAIVETIVPIINDFQPTVDIMPREQNDVNFADMMNKRFQQVVDDTDLYHKILLAVKDALIYSNGFIQVLPELNDDGVFTGFDIHVIDPFTVIPHPYATDMNLEQGEYFCFAVPMECAKIYRDYGVKCEPEGKLDDYRAFQQTEEGDMAYTSSHEKDADVALVIECYSNEPDVKKYPHGRHTVIVRDKLIVDEPLELYRMPVFMVSNYKSPHTFWGIGEPDNVRTQTKAFNEIFSAINENIKRTGYPIRKVTQRAKGQMTRPIMGAPGEEITVVDPNDVTFENPPPIPAYVQNFITQMGLFMEQISGVNDVTQGRTHRDLSGRAVVALQEASQTRQRFKINKEVAKFTKDIGEFMVQMILSFDDETRTIRERDAEGEYQFTQFDPLGVYDADGNPETSPEFDPRTSKSLKDSLFDVDVTTGSRYAQGRVANEERAIQLFGAGITGIEEVVNALNIDNKQEVIENWYIRNQMISPQQQKGQAEQAQAEFDSAVAQAMAEGPGGPAEEAVANMIIQAPPLAGSDSFKSLPPDMQQRIEAVADLVGGQEEQQEQNVQPRA